ncbi:LTA synthase family protein [Sinomicrobium oceani]|uniref:LTA synthase family protein n=1 Tax=Sinomicrobium oceani TaxID=1150368 RepID=UPI00227C0283|nr:LTA synthase family protein [Sinomicrobium oceani]
MKHYFFTGRFALLRVFVVFFLLLSFIVRCSLLIWDFRETDTGIIDLFRIFGTGLFFDLGTVSFFAVPYALYLILMPAKWTGSLPDRIMTYTGFGLGVLLLYFSFFAEFTFWDEFHRRFNFIAVDYLIYTYEVVKNINESYPIPVLICAMLILMASTLFTVYRFSVFHQVFLSADTLGKRGINGVPWLVLLLLFGIFVSNEDAEWSSNRYDNELSKAGIFSFFAAFRNNELSYPEFYRTLPEKQAFEEVANRYKDRDRITDAGSNPVCRYINRPDSAKAPLKPNVIFICVESLSARFLGSFGNRKNLTPNLDTLAAEGILFTNLYATGTRTVRGMEAITLSIPPTPGRSIVKRAHHTDMFTIGEVFRQQGYTRHFFYGGDGYFDNMNAFFSGNGFDIVDRGRGFLMGDGIRTNRTNINDEEVTFENAWGVCDEDIFRKVIRQADIQEAQGKPFFDFIMTTSNHKPYTYPEGKIDIPSGTGREGAVKYTDYAIGEFVREARKKPWFEHTVLVIMSDHCASSAGRWELDVDNYHIPALIYNLPGSTPARQSGLCSQIDLFPTLFGYLNWSYTSSFFGEDIHTVPSGQERAFVGNYRKLGLLKGDRIMVLGDRKTANFYRWDPHTDALLKQEPDPDFLLETISFYQVAESLYTGGKLDMKNQE